MKKKHQTFFICLSVLFAFMLGFTIKMQNGLTKYSPSEYARAIWERDSIDITEKQSEYAKIYLKKILDKQVKNYYIRHAEFDDSLKAYEVLYEFNLDKEENDSYSHMKTVWVRINFNSNNGNYIVKPQLIKLISWKDKEE